MATFWIDTVVHRGRLSIYAGATLRGGNWLSVFNQALREFNALSRTYHLRVILAGSSDPPAESGGGADVAIDTASENISYSYGGARDSEGFDGSRMHGRTFQASREGKIEKAFVFLPQSPLINTPQGQRPVGAGVMLVIAVHELLHACGLSNSDHTQDDLFQGNPQVDYGSSAAADRVLIQAGGRTRRMPPLVLSGATATKIKDLWAP